MGGLEAARHRRQDDKFLRALHGAYPHLVPNPPANDRELSDWESRNLAARALEQRRSLTQLKQADLAGYKWTGTLSSAIIADVAKAFGVRPEWLTGKDRSQVAMVPRWVCIRLLRDIVLDDGTPRFSTTEIGRIMKRDHSSIVHALQNFDVKMRSHPRANEIYLRLRAKLGGGDA